MSKTRIPFEVDDQLPPSASQNLSSSETSLFKIQGVSHEEPSVFTVSQLTRRIRNLLEGRFKGLIVEGEMSNVHHASSGHWYFTLKDADAQIRGVIFRQYATRLHFHPEDGLEVIIRGHLSVYSPRGEYQINAASIEPKGVGALQLAFEQLKNRLSSEGLFDPKLKRTLPLLPRCIGLITSPGGAAVHDLLSVLKRRFDGIPTLLYPVLVQGELAPLELIEGLRVLNQMRSSKRIDVIILGRGGGTLEDLWAFNDETLARSIRASEIPVISAVGHETDFTISDFVSDLRAPTPSVAMELVVPKKADLLERTELNTQALKRIVLERMAHGHGQNSGLRNRLPTPRAAIEHCIQRSDELDRQLSEKIRHFAFRHLNRVHSLREGLFMHNPERQLEMMKRNLTEHSKHLPNNIRSVLDQHRKNWQNYSSLLDSLSPLAVLKRGFSLSEREDGKLIRSVFEVKTGETLKIRLEDGKLKTRVLGKNIIPRNQVNSV